MARELFPRNVCTRSFRREIYARAFARNHRRRRRLEARRRLHLDHSHFHPRLLAARAGLLTAATLTEPNMKRAATLLCLLACLPAPAAGQGHARRTSRRTSP